MPPRLSFEGSFSELIDTTRSIQKKQDSSRDFGRRRTVSFAISQELLFSKVDESISRKTMWYSKQEIEHFKKENSRSVQAMLSGKHRQMPGFCERGLENMTRAGALQSKNHKKFSQKVVLDEQRKQRENGESDVVDMIAQIYEQASRRSQVAAAARGENDAREACC
jgi:hypothetical protein